MKLQDLERIEKAVRIIHNPTYTGESYNNTEREDFYNRQVLYYFNDKMREHMEAGIDAFAKYVENKEKEIREVV